MEKIQGNIFQIQRWSINDGEGLRTTVFLKGCQLRCKWCANPESWSGRPELLYFNDRCSGCGKCVQVCEAKAITFEKQSIIYHKEKCLACSKCCEVCPTGARKMIGSRVTVADVLQVIKRDTIFYRESGGGVTFSGGEPFAQMEFLRALVESCKKLFIDTTVETSGYFNWQQASAIFELLDGVFIDIKHINPDSHVKLTGVNNIRILENVVAISKAHPKVIVRVPLISEVNDQEDNIREMCGFLAQNTRITEIELLPYHDLGVAKFNALGISNNQSYGAPSAGQIERLEKIIRSYGLKVVNFK